MLFNFPIYQTILIQGNLLQTKSKISLIESVDQKSRRSLAITDQMYEKRER